DDTVGAVDGDIVVSTTIDLRMQMAAEGALTQALNEKGEQFGVSQGALVALDPNGAIRALVGGRDYSESQFNRAVSAKRQPGSAFKPFVYLAGLEHGMTPDTVRDDAPLNIKGWKPENYSHEYFGPVTLTRALSLSLNTVAVRVGVEVGAKTVAKTAHRLGVQSDLQINPSIALGTSEVTPLELVTAYAPFANDGVAVQPYVILRVKTAAGKTIYQRKGTNFGRVVASQYIAMMNDMMQETLLTGTARKARLPGWEAAGKTGTSQDFRDAWFIGYTGRLVAGVWLGNDDSSPTKKASGGNLPVEIWSRFMTVALKGVPVAGLPGGAWRPEAPVAAAQEVAGDAARAIAKPLDDLIDMITGARPAPTPPQRPAPIARPAPNPKPDLHEDPPRAEAAAPPHARQTAPVPDDLLPPEDIPTVGSIPAGRPHGRRGAQRFEEREKNLLDQLFGG
ncbi:MAG: penicillin-binding transpeptidase domain-containing protein, partial [Methylocystis sp.]|nr:penicillin-binding transpeptidase domain-containing protein [Methylocystis sp.]